MADNAGVANDVAAYGMYFATDVDAGASACAVVPTAVTTTAQTVPVMSFLAVWVEFTMCSLGYGPDVDPPGYR
jgi:hypothetical protein